MNTYERAASEIIKLLERRGGFDHWWDDIDEECKKEILEAIAEVIDDNV